MVPVLALVVPCYNEEEAIRETFNQLASKLKNLIDANQISSESYICFIDDGSSDRTWAILQDITNHHPCARLIKLSRNFGHQNALLSGLMYVKDKCDCAVSLDADLQDDINAIDKMLESFSKGNEIVYGIREKREFDSFFKRHTAELFYKLMKKMGVTVHDNHADYRLTSARVLEGLSVFDEVNIFLRGIFPLLGYKSDQVYYERKERIAGTTKYPLKKMLLFAIDGITSFSVIPLRFISILGLIFSVFSFFMMLYVLVDKYILHGTIHGWSSIILSIYFLGGVQLLAIGVLGEYIGKIYQEAKRRPRFIIEKVLG